MSPRRWLIALAALAYGRHRRRTLADRSMRQGSDGQSPLQAEGGAPDGRIVPEGPPSPKAELAVVVLLLAAAGFAAGFIVIYAELGTRKIANTLLGVCIAGALGCVAVALTLIAKRLVVTEELEEDYPEEHPAAQAGVARLVRESGSRFTRRRLLLAAGSVTGAALGLAGLAPVLSLGPLWYTEPLAASPWRRGRRLVDLAGRPFLASEIEEETFYSAFPEGADPEQIASPLILVRLPPSQLKLPPQRAGWAPYGILAYSRICTHAGCAIVLYRKPRFPVVEPRPALVCPCHYSTFDPADGAKVIFGPAGRPLPQLPLMIDTSGHLRAAGDYSGRVGPGWWGVRSRPS